MTTDTVSLRGPEVREFTGVQFRAVDGTDSGSYLEGRAVPYDTWADIGWFMESHAPGSFARSIREAAGNLPLLLWHDNKTFPIGAAHEWRDNDNGLDCVWKIDTADTRAVEATRKAKDGLLTGLSIGFAPVNTRSLDDTPIDHEIREDDNGLLWVRWLESRLFEVSLTPTPAFAGAKVTHVRSRFGVHMREAGKLTRRRSAEVDAWRNYLTTIQRKLT